MSIRMSIDKVATFCIICVGSPPVRSNSLIYVVIYKVKNMDKKGIQTIESP